MFLLSGICLKIRCVFFINFLVCSPSVCCFATESMTCLFVWSLVMTCGVGVLFNNASYFVCWFFEGSLGMNLNKEYIDNYRKL